MKPLIIGEAPGKNGDPTKPIEGRVGARLAACAGITFEEFLETFDRVNLLQEQPQDAPKGMTFNVKLAGRAAKDMERSFVLGQTILVLGKRAASAFGLTKVRYFDLWFTPTGAKMYVVPHPSGANRWYNELDNELAMIKFMRRIVEQVRG